MSVDAVWRILEEKKKKLAVMHHNADLDCVASSIALALSFEGFSVYAPLGVSSVGKKILRKYGIEWLEKVSLDDYDLLVILDTNSLEQLGEFNWERVKGKTVIIDHHDYNPKYEEALLYVWKEETSCSEIVLQIIESAGKKINDLIAESLIVGIIGDTARFKFAKNSTFQNLCRLIPHIRRDFSEILREIEEVERGGNLDRSRRIALAKAMQRSTYLDFKGVLIWKSFVSSFEGEIASTITALLADIALVGAQRKEEARVSVRARKWLIDKGLNLAEICRKVAQEFSGGGGGHAAAAGINVIGDVEAVVNALIEELKEKLREIL